MALPIDSTIIGVSCSSLTALLIAGVIFQLNRISDQS